MNMMLKIDNNTNINFLGKDLIKAIYSVAKRLDANYVVVNIARYNKYAEVDLFSNNDCIEWGYYISTK